MSNETEGLTQMPGTFSCPGSRGEWQMWRNKDGEIELYRTGRIDENGTKHGLERKVTKARTIPELYAYFSNRPKPRATGDDKQIDLYDEAERLAAEQQRHEQND